MSSHPNVILVAQLKLPSGVYPEEFVEQFENGEVLVNGDYLRMVATGDNDQGVYPQDERHIATYDYAAYGWGNTLLIEHFNKFVDVFTSRLVEFCQQYDCAITSVKVGANYW